MANAKKRDILIKKASDSFSKKMKNLSEQVEYYNKKHNDSIMEIVVIPPLDNTMYPKLRLSTKKR